MTGIPAIGLSRGALGAGLGEGRILRFFDSWMLAAFVRPLKNGQEEECDAVLRAVGPGPVMELKRALEFLCLNDADPVVEQAYFCEQVGYVSAYFSFLHDLK